jgi:hypothetical protein
MTSSGSNQAGLAANISKGKVVEGEEGKGLFGSILNSMQNLKQQNAEVSEETLGEGQETPEKVGGEEEKATTEVQKEAQEEVVAEIKNESLASVLSVETKEIVSEENTIEQAGEENQQLVLGSEEDLKIDSESRTVEVKAENKIIAEAESNGQTKQNYEVGSLAAPKQEAQPKVTVKGEEVSTIKVLKEVESEPVETKEVSKIINTDIEAETKMPKEVEVEKHQPKEAPTEGTAKTEMLAQEDEAVSSDNAVKKPAPKTGNTSPLEQAPSEFLKSSPQSQTERIERSVSSTQETANIVQASPAKVVSEQITEGAKDVAQVVQTQKVEDNQEKKFRKEYVFSGRQELNTERLELVTSLGGTKSGTNPLSRFETAADFLNAKAKGDASGMLSEEQEMMIKNHLKESTELQDQEAAAMQTARLGEVPISNFTIKRVVLPGLTQAVQKSVSAGKAAPEAWQKHSFELEDGNSIQLSTREVDGVVQIKLASSSAELNRLMQQYEKEIKQYLEQECELDVNLQFSGDESGQEMSNFFGDSSSSGNKGNGTSGLFKSAMTSPQNNEHTIQKSVRRFGYNQMEWTA